MLIKKTRVILIGLPVISAGFLIAFAVDATPGAKPEKCPVECCRQKCTPPATNPESNSPGLRSIFLPEKFFPGV